MASQYPKEEMAALAMVAENALKKSIGLWQVSKMVPSRKVGAAVSWDLEEDSEERRAKAVEEFITEMKERVAKEMPGATQMLKGEGHVFSDTSVFKMAKLGIYGWLEVVCPETNS